MVSKASLDIPAELFCSVLQLYPRLPEDVLKDGAALFSGGLCGGGAGGAGRGFARAASSNLNSRIT